MLNCLAFTSGKNVPSARFRIRQYIDAVRPRGVYIKEACSMMGGNPPADRWARVLWGMLSLGERAPYVLKSHFYDVTLLQREMLPTLVTLEPLTHRPRVLDVDDAIWLHGRGTTAQQLATLCDAVICGNAFLAEQFGKWNRNIAIIPTAIDTERFFPAPETQRELLIGWAGTSSNYRYLYGIESALRTVLERVPAAKLRIISDKAPVFLTIPSVRTEYFRWSETDETRQVQEISVGIVPIEDSTWARGKCSYKMLLYMACGVPVVVSPVGMNKEILDIENVGFGVTSEEDWIDSLVFLLENEAARMDMGQHARRVAVERFSLPALAPEFANTLLAVAGGRGG